MDEQFELWLAAYSDLKGWTLENELLSLDLQEHLYDAFRAGWEYRRLLEL